MGKEEAKLSNPALDNDNCVIINAKKGWFYQKTPFKQFPISAR